MTPLGDEDDLLDEEDSDEQDEDGEGDDEDPLEIVELHPVPQTRRNKQEGKGALLWKECCPKLESFWA